jgi:hypothetical protein
MIPITMEMIPIIMEMFPITMEMIPIKNEMQKVRNKKRSSLLRQPPFYGLKFCFIKSGNVQKRGLLPPYGAYLPCV